MMLQQCKCLFKKIFLNVMDFNLVHFKFETNFLNYVLMLHVIPTFLQFHCLCALIQAKNRGFHCWRIRKMEQPKKGRANSVEKMVLDNEHGVLEVDKSKPSPNWGTLTYHPVTNLKQMVMTTVEIVIAIQAHQFIVEDQHKVGSDLYMMGSLKSKQTHSQVVPSSTTIFALCSFLVYWEVCFQMVHKACIPD